MQNATTANLFRVATFLSALAALTQSNAQVHDATTGFPDAASSSSDSLPYSYLYFGLILGTEISLLMLGVAYTYIYCLSRNQNANSEIPEATGRESLSETTPLLTDDTSPNAVSAESPTAFARHARNVTDKSKPAASDDVVITMNPKLE